jgi:Zn-dependent protease with chaperone function
MRQVNIRQKLLSITLASCFVFLFTFTNLAFAQSDLKNYTEQLLSNFNKEIDTINNFSRAYQKADFENEFSISLFQSSIKTYRNSFNGYLSFYRTTLPSDTPADLKDAVNTAIGGTEQIVSGLNNINSALNNRDNAGLQGGENSLNGGTVQVNSAIKKYNSWVDTQNARAQTSQSSSVSSDDLGLGSAFSSTFHYGKPLLYVYIYLLIAGFMMSKNFKSKLKNLVGGKVQSEKFKGTALYGLHLIILFPYLYILLAFSILLVWDFALVGVLIVSNLERIPIALIIALVVVVLGSFWAILKGFFGSKKRNILGVPLKKEEQQKIWNLCDKVAKEVGTKTVDEIFLSPQPGIGVHLSGGLSSLLIGRTKRTLTIGMGSISALSISEMEAILTHEFGHFSNKDTAWNSLTFTMAAALQNTLSTMPNPWNSGDSGWMKLTSALNPALWVLFGYRLLFSVVTNGFSRMREVFADKTAIALYGYKNFTNGLMKVARNDYVFSSYFVPDMIKMLTQEGKIYTNLFHTMDQTYKSIEQSKLTDIDKSILDQEKPSMFDSHPLMKDRMAYAKHFEVDAKHATNNNDFKELFEKWDEVSKNMSDLYTYYIAVLTGYKFEQDKEDGKKEK